MRAALAIAVALLAAPPAAASETIGRSALTTGPVLAGGSVLWADAPSGRPRMLAGGPGRNPAVLASWPRRGAALQAIGSAGAQQVRIAGRYLAYLEGRRRPERAVLYDLERRQRVRRVAGTALAGVDVQADGTLALVRTAGARSCVSVLRRRAARERRLACRLATSRVAIAGGRVLVERGTERGPRLVLLGRGGRRVLERAQRPRTIGCFDLAADRAVWSVGPVSGRQRIEHERL